MWASIEAARKAANGTHIAIRIDNLRYDEDSDGKLRVDLMVGSLKTVGMVALPSDISVGVTPDQGKRIRYEATAVAEMTESVSPRLHAILDGKPEGIIQFHELPGIGSIGDPSRGDLMAGFTKAPFYGAAYKKRGLVKGIALMSRASTQPRVEYVCGLLQGTVTDIARSMAQFNSQEIAALDAKIADGIDEDELADLEALKELKVDKGRAVNRVLQHAGEYFTAYAEQARMFDVRDALVELTGVLPRGAPPGDIINIARSYGREMHVLTILQRTGEVESTTLNVLNTVWNRLKGTEGATFVRLTAKIWKESPTIVDYGETAKKKATLYAVKLKGLMAIGPDWEYDGQGAMAQVKDYQRIMTPNMTAIDQVKYVEVLHRVALEQGVHLKTSSSQGEIHVAPINCTPEDDAWDITYTFVKTDRITGYTTDISNLEMVHVATPSTDPIDSGFKRAIADGDLARSMRVWAHTFITKQVAVESGLLAASGEAEADWVKPAARFQNFQATSAAATAKGAEESKEDDSKFDRLMAAMAEQNAQQDKNLTQIREAQTQSQQAQTQLMQLMAMMYAGQEQQRLANAWVVQSVEAISTSSGCAIEAPPASHEIVELPPALVRMTQSAAQGATTIDPKATELAAAAPAAAGPAVLKDTDSGGGASPSRMRKRRGRGGAAGTPAAAAKAAASSPARATKQPPGNVGMPPSPEAMDGREDAEELFFEQCSLNVDAEVDGQLSPHGTAKVMKSLYENLFGNANPTKAQMMGGGARERTPSEVESDAQRLEEQLLASTPSAQDF